MARLTLAALSALALAAGCGPPAQQAETTPPPAPEAIAPTTQMSDAAFVQNAANSDAFEIQSSELAPRRAARQDVKDFAEMMVRDHRSTSGELGALAPTLGMTAPTPALGGTMQSTLGTLRDANGEAFDDAYLDAQVEAHENGVRLFEEYLQGAPTGPLRDWATNTLPRLRTHLEHVRGLENAT